MPWLPIATHSFTAIQSRDVQLQDHWVQFGVFYAASLDWTLGPPLRAGGLSTLQASDRQSGKEVEKEIGNYMARLFLSIT